MYIYFYNFLIVLITTFWYQVFMRFFIYKQNAFFLNKRKYLYFNNVLSILIYNLFPSFGQFYNRMFIKISIFPQKGIIPKCCFNCIILLANWPTIHWCIMYFMFSLFLKYLNFSKYLQQIIISCFYECEFAI